MTDEHLPAFAQRSGRLPGHVVGVDEVLEECECAAVVDDLVSAADAAQWRAGIRAHRDELVGQDLRRTAKFGLEQHRPAVDVEVDPAQA